MRKTSILAAFLLAFSLSAIAQHTDTIPEPVISRDSINQDEDWTIRAPLSNEELQKREDNRARVARMKQRFRNFHDTEEEELKKVEQEATESDFLWSDGQQGGGQQTQPETTTKGGLDANEEESLRLEISRSLQYGKSPDIPPASPVLPPPPQETPSTPETYDNVNTTAIERDIKSAFQATGNKTTTTSESSQNWQTEISTTDEPLPEKELTYHGLSAGQSYLLGITFAHQQYALGTENLTILDNWANWLKQHPAMRVEVRAYIHHQTDPLEAIDLSIQRAKAVVDYWLTQGALEQQIAYKGYGSLSPLVPNTDPAAKQKNERIEVIILELPTR